MFSRKRRDGLPVEIITGQEFICLLEIAASSDPKDFDDARIRATIERCRAMSERNGDAWFTVDYRI